MNILKLFFICTMLCSCSLKEYYNGVNPSCAQKETLFKIQGKMVSKEKVCFLRYINNKYNTLIYSISVDEKRRMFFCELTSSYELDTCSTSDFRIGDGWLIASDAKEKYEHSEVRWWDNLCSDFWELSNEQKLEVLDRWCLESPIHF